jgi:low affinity Fe/Cu permease
MINHMFERIGERVASWSGRPAAFMGAFAIIVVWAASGPLFGWSDTWQLVINTGTTIVTFLMVFLIQNAQNRDGAELIRSVGHARNQFIGIEHLSQGELILLLQRLEEVAGDEGARRLAIERMIGRR